MWLSLVVQGEEILILGHQDTPLSMRPPELLRVGCAAQPGLDRGDDVNAPPTQCLSQRVGQVLVELETNPIQADGASVSPATDWWSFAGRLRRSRLLD